MASQSINHINTPASYDFGRGYYPFQANTSATFSRARFVATVFAGSFLLFLVQPMVAHFGPGAADAALVRAGRWG